MDKLEYKMWRFFYRELIKLNEVIIAYDKIFRNIDVRNNRYNVFFQLILDAFTRYICVTLALFFDKRKDAWSLYKFRSIGQKQIDALKGKAKPFMDLRHQRFVHISKRIVHKNNFKFLTYKSIKEVKKLIEEISKVLMEISDKENLKESYLLGWGGVAHSLGCFIEDIKKGK